MDSAMFDRLVESYWELSKGCCAFPGRFGLTVESSVLHVEFFAVSFVIIEFR
jgi:hypothetical protein